ncbi:response regulator transcription factor [Chloroflexota bacterium]
MEKGNNDIRILLVDDHQVVREGLQHMLEQEEDMQVVGQASNSEETLLQTEMNSPNIVLMDIKMPGVDGIELTRRLREKQPQCNIIMLTLYDEYLSEAIEAGAVGYLLKDAKRTELIEAIHQVSQGKIVISESISAKSRDSYTEKLSEKAKENLRQQSDEPICEEIQMVIPPPVDANQLISFISQVEETLQSHMLQMVGSWKGDTAITMSLAKPTMIEEITTKLKTINTVNSIGDEPPEGTADISLFKKVSNMPKLKANIRKTFFLTLLS